MIGSVLAFLRQKLDGYLRAQFYPDSSEPVADQVVFLDGDKMDPVVFQSGAVSQILISLEEERLLRSADPYSRVQEDGTVLHTQPDLRLGLQVLFVAHFKQHDRAWDHLAKILEYLQTHRTFEREGTPDLPATVDRLTVELVTLSFAEQNDLWSALRTTCHPFLLYRVRLLILRDVKPVARTKITEPISITVKRIS